MKFPACPGARLWAASERGPGGVGRTRTTQPAALDANSGIAPAGKASAARAAVSLLTHTHILFLFAPFYSLYPIYTAHPV